MTIPTDWNPKNRASYLFFGFIVFSFSMIVLPERIQMVNNLFYLFVLLPALVYFVKSQPKSQGDLLFLKWFFVLFVTAFISIIINDPSLKSLLTIVKHSLYLLAFYALLLITYSFQQKMISILFAFLIMVTALSIYKLQVDPAYTNDLYRIRSVSALGSSPLLADLIGCYGFYLFSEKLKQKNYIGMSVILVLSIGSILILEGRAIMVALAIVGPLWVLTFPIENKNKIILIVSVILFAVLAVFYLIFGFGYFYEVIGRGNGRVEIWSNLFQEVKICGYFLGCGYQADSSMNILVEGFWSFYPYYHNIFLSSLFYTGIVGMIVFLGFLFAAFRKSYQVHSIWGYLLLLSLISLCFEGDKLLTNPSVIWYLLWIPIFYCYLSSHEKNNKSS